MFLASLFGYLLNTFLSHDALYSWGWRVPFAFGILIGPIGYYIRSKMDETPEFSTVEKVNSAFLSTVTTHLPRLLTSAGIVALASIAVYLILYMPTFAVKSLHLPGYAGYLGGIIAGLVALEGTPFVGNLADRVGAAKVMTYAAVAAIVLAWPLFKVLHAYPTVLTLTLVQIVFGILMAVYFGPLPALYAELLPTNVRTTGMAVGYNVGVLIFGGFAAAIFTWLIEWTHTTMSPSYYFIAVGVVSLIAVLFGRRRFGLH